MATTAKRNATVDRLLKKSGEPTIDALDYVASLTRALNWYNAEADNKTKKRWFQEHFGKNARGVSEVHEREFRSVGTLCRLVDNKQYLDQKELDFIQVEFERIKQLANKPKKVVEPKEEDQIVKAPTIQDRLDEQASDLVGRFNEMIDEFTFDRKKIPDVVALMKQHPTAPVAKKAKAKIQKIIEELQEAVAGKDKQLTEGYSNFTKPELKKLLAAYEAFDQALEQTKKVVVRKRAVKPVSAAKLVSRMSFVQSDPTLGLNSINPITIVGASELWIYNIKTKKMQSYVAMDGLTLTVKGKSIMNFDPKKSEQKTVRKPETVKELTGKPKRAYSTFMKGLTTKPAESNGRVSADCVLMAAFK